MPTFCRHNRFVENCRICAPKEPPKAPAKRASTAGRASGTTRSRTSSGARASSGGMRVRQMARAAEDGYASPLVPGLRASADARRLADELGFATGRLVELAAAPPGLLAEAGSAPNADEGIWLAAQAVLLGPRDDQDDPFEAIRAAATTWASGAVPAADAIAGLGPRSPYRDQAAAARGLASLRAWAERGGGPAGALAGDPSWTPERRFERLFERLGTVGGMGRARYDLLVVLGRLGLADVQPASLQPGDSDDTTVAAKRVFGIGDRFVLERRAAELADAAEVPIAALDLALVNLNRPPAPAAQRIAVGSDPTAIDADARDRAAAALGV